jgi:putative transposase
LLLKPGRLISPPGTYFVTFSTWQRRKLFVVENDVRLFLKTLYRYRRERRYELHAFVVMPEHVHLLLTPANDVTIEHAIQLIKGSYSHALGSVLGRRREIWQRGFTDHRIRDEQDFLHHQNYIHCNPVERKLINEPCEYRYSSAYPGFRLDPFPSAAEAEISKIA